MTDSTGRRVNFKNCVIIMTSNIGAQKIAQQKNLGFGTGSVQEQNMKREVQKELKEYFRPEFLNRIDGNIVFSIFDTAPVGTDRLQNDRTAAESLKRNRGGRND